jgi:hypothetical protein
VGGEESLTASGSWQEDPIAIDFGSLLYVASALVGGCVFNVFFQFFLNLFTKCAAAVDARKGCG